MKIKFMVFWEKFHPYIFALAIAIAFYAEKVRIPKDLLFSYVIFCSIFCITCALSLRRGFKNSSGEKINAFKSTKYHLLLNRYFSEAIFMTSITFIASIIGVLFPVVYLFEVFSVFLASASLFAAYRVCMFCVRLANLELNELTSDIRK